MSPSASATKIRCCSGQLDDAPIAKSNKVLVQVVTENRLTGFETKPAKFTIGKGDGAYAVEGE